MQAQSNALPRPLWGKDQVKAPVKRLAVHQALTGPA